MRLLFLSLVTVTFLNADEISRFQDILKDMSELKISYEKSQNDLEIYKQLLEQEKVKNEKLLIEVDSCNKNVGLLKDDLEYMQQQLLNIKQKNVEKEEVVKQEPKKEKIISPTALTTFSPSSFRLKEAADIYIGDKKEKYDRWDSGRSFTSNVKNGEWIKITGFFIDKKWQSAKDELWIKSDKVIKRD